MGLLIKNAQVLIEEEFIDIESDDMVIIIDRTMCPTQTKQAEQRTVEVKGADKIEVTIPPSARINEGKENKHSRNEWYFIGDKLKSWLKIYKKESGEHWVTLEEVARRAKVASSNMSGYANNKRRTTIPVITRLAAVFGLTFEEFMGFDPRFGYNPIEKSKYIPDKPAQQNEPPIITEPPIKENPDEVKSPPKPEEKEPVAATERKKKEGPVYRNLGGVIRLWLERHDPPLKQKELAEHLEVSDFVVSKVINHAAPIDEDTLEQIVKFVGARSITDFMKIDQDEI